MMIFCQTKIGHLPHIFFCQAHPQAGAVGGQIYGDFEFEPPPKYRGNYS